MKQKSVWSANFISSLRSPLLNGPKLANRKVMVTLPLFFIPVHITSIFQNIMSEKDTTWASSSFFFKWFNQRKATREFFQLIWARLFGCMSLHQRRWTLINFFLVDLIDGNGCFSNPAISYGKSAILAPNSRFLLFLRKTIYGSHINDIIYHSPLTVSFLGSSFLLDRSPTMTDDRTSKSVISVFSQIHLL